METGILAAIEGLEKENAGLQPELMTVERARELMAAYARAEKLVSFGVAALSRKLADSEVARLTGSSMGKAKHVVATGKVMAASAELAGAMQQETFRSIRLWRSPRPRSRFRGLLASW